LLHTVERRGTGPTEYVTAGMPQGKTPTKKPTKKAPITKRQLTPF